ncbi:MAG: hypothetical protein V1738_00945 [Patescibacteria group bacterium]
MKVVFDILLKIVQFFLMPILLRLIDIVSRYFLDRYKSDENFRKQVDSLFTRLVSMFGPRIMKLYLDYKMKATKREREKKKKTEDKSRTAAEKAKPIDTTAETDTDDESSLTQTAAETARLSAEVAGRLARRAGKKTKSWLSWVRNKLEEETGLTDDGKIDLSKSTNSSYNEDEEIERLKKQLDAETDKKSSKPKQETAPESDPSPIDVTSPENQPATKPVSAESDEKKPTTPAAAEQAAEQPAADNVSPPTEPQIGFSDGLKSLLEKEKKIRDSNDR